MLARIIGSGYLLNALSSRLCPQFEDAAREAADELTAPRPEGEEEVQDVQVLLKSDANPTQIRELRVSGKSKSGPPASKRGEGGRERGWEGCLFQVATEATSPPPFLYISFHPCLPLPLFSISPFLQSDHMARLVKVPGIVISASGIRAKATRITIQCRSCRVYLPNIALKPGLEGYSLPRKCNT